MDGEKVERERGVKKEIACLCAKKSAQENELEDVPGTAERSTTSAAAAAGSASVKSSHISHAGFRKLDFKHP